MWSYWNDEYAQSQAEVVEAFDKTIRRLERGGCLMAIKEVATEDVTQEDVDRAWKKAHGG